jgi:hypothetical protein
VLVGPDAKFLDVMVRLTGSGYMRLFAPVIGAQPGLKKPKS